MKGLYQMGKFSGILLCSDLDDTLLTTDKRVSEENRDAIEYFKANGGIFTFATGRIPHGAKIIFKYIMPNAPMICFNGAGIYDFEKNSLIWNLKLHDDKVKVMEYVEKQCPFSGMEVCCKEKVYFCKMNKIVEEHKMHEWLPDRNADYHDISEEWVKVLFIQEKDEVELVRKVLAESEFNDRFDFIQSSPFYYEMLPKDASKGNALLKLAHIMGIKNENVIAAGDNENDVSMIKSAGVGFAVKNAVPEALSAADIVTVDNNSHAIKAVIKWIEENKV